MTSTPQWWKFSQKVLDLKRPIREAMRFDEIGLVPIVRFDQQNHASVFRDFVHPHERELLSVEQPLWVVVAQAHQPVAGQGASRPVTAQLLIELQTCAVEADDELVDTCGRLVLHILP